MIVQMFPMKLGRIKTFSSPQISSDSLKLLAWMANQYLADLLNWRQAYSTSSLNENSEKFGEKNVDNAGYIKKVKKRKKISVHPNVYICNVL